MPVFEASFIIAHNTDLVLTAHVRRLGSKMKISYKEETIFALDRQTPGLPLELFHSTKKKIDRGWYPTEELSNHNFPAFPE